MTDKDLEPRFKAFLDQYWPLPSVNTILTDNDIKAFKRQVWYCSASGLFIPELQKYNVYPIILTYKQSELLCSKFYQQGYTNYRVYKTGHAFLDIHIIGMLFDYFINSYYSPKPTIEDMMKYINKLPDYENNPFVNTNNVLDMYKLVTNFSTGTIYVRDTVIPKKAIKYIGSEFRDGDVVDTSGYRGTGLFIKDGNEFIPVDRREYYPIWPLKFLRHKGYIHYLKNSFCQYFDELKFENGISFYPYLGFGPTNLENHNDDKNFDTKNYIRFNDGKVQYNHDMQWLILTLNDTGFYDVPYPFANVGQANALMKTDLLNSIKFRANISDHDYLVFSKTLYIYDSNDSADLNV